jgi:glycosyltransferase involved in cell wall biosynthesis
VQRTGPQVSIVVPVFNEAAIIEEALTDLQQRLKPLARSYEIILAENGSRDGTQLAVRRLQARYPELSSVSIGQPNYGLALRLGIEAARGDYVMCDEVDLLDTDFYARALPMLERGEADLVIGSKLLGGARDERPLFRHVGSLAYTRLLKVLLDFPGTDTHGLKAMRRTSMLPIVRACQVDKDVFASELVIRAYRNRLNVVEIPTTVQETRPPSIDLYKRIPNVCVNLAKLTWAIRFTR